MAAVPGPGVATLPNIHLADVKAVHRAARGAVECRVTFKCSSVRAQWQRPAVLKLAVDVSDAFGPAGEGLLNLFAVVWPPEPPETVATAWMFPSSTAGTGRLAMALPPGQDAALQLWSGPTEAGLEWWPAHDDDSKTFMGVDPGMMTHVLESSCARRRWWFACPLTPPPMRVPGRGGRYGGVGVRLDPGPKCPVPLYAFPPASESVTVRKQDLIRCRWCGETFECEQAFRARCAPDLGPLDPP